jgi:integrase
MIRDLAVSARVNHDVQPSTVEHQRRHDLRELAEILREHRMLLLRTQAKGLAEGRMFPSAEGTLRTPNSLDRAWAKCLAHAKLTKRFTVHGLRYTFTDLVRRANVDAGSAGP